MENLNHSASSSEGGLDVVIKVLTIVKLLMQTAFWGLMLGFIIWSFYHNPLPKLIDDITTSVTKSMLNQQNQLIQDGLKSLTGQIRKP